MKQIDTHTKRSIIHSIFNATEFEKTGATTITTPMSSQLSGEGDREGKRETGREREREMERGKQGKRGRRRGSYKIKPSCIPYVIAMKTQTSIISTTRSNQSEDLSILILSFRHREDNEFRTRINWSQQYVKLLSFFK